VINCGAFTAGSSQPRAYQTPSSQLWRHHINAITAYKSQQEERSFASFLQPALELRTRLLHR
jgi:hypothetical protein